MIRRVLAALAALCLLGLAARALAADAPDYARELDGALRCAGPAGDPALIRDILTIAECSGLPDPTIVLAAACRESRFRAAARGDGGLSVGIVQARRWMIRHCWGGVDHRRDPRLAVECWSLRIVELRARAERECPGRPWAEVAHAWVAAGPQGYRCRMSRHLGVLRRWRR